MFIRQSAKFNTEWVLISVAIMGLSPYILEIHTEKCIDKMIHLGFASKLQEGWKGTVYRLKSGPKFTTAEAR